MSKVLIIYSQVKQYRLPFYDKLYAALKQDGVDLRIAYSDPARSERKKKDNRDLPAEYGIKVKSLWTPGEKMIYQPLIRESLSSDLVIVEYATKYVLNHVLLCLSALGSQRLAVWGLENRQLGLSAASEWYKRQTLRWVDWCFAYTPNTARYFRENGVPSSRITTVQNAVDTREIRDTVRRLGPAVMTETRATLQIAPDDPVGIYCGMIDPVKKIDFLIESSRIVRKELGRFHLILLGDGTLKDMLVQATAAEPWIHFVGPRFGTDKVKLLRMADVVLNPGRVGLVILDAFAVGRPLLTTQLPIHGPEIEYLEEERNGIMTDPQPEAYARAVISLFQHRERLQHLQAGAALSGETYTIENMTENFRQGILSCLSMPKGVLEPSIG